MKRNLIKAEKTHTSVLINARYHTPLRVQTTVSHISLERHLKNIYSDKIAIKGINTH